MAAIARERIAREGWRNVTVVQSGAEDAQIAVTADAALFCAVHDILQSPDALRNVMNHLHPGAQVAAGGLTLGSYSARPDRGPPNPAQVATFKEDDMPGGKVSGCSTDSGHGTA